MVAAVRARFYSVGRFFGARSVWGNVQNCLLGELDGWVRIYGRKLIAW